MTGAPTRAYVSPVRVHTHQADREGGTLVHGALSVPRARVFHDANQSIDDSTVTALAFNSERFDTDGIHDTATNNSRLTCATAGTYLIGASVEWASSATGNRNLSLRLNGTTFLVGVAQTALTGATTQQQFATLYDLAAADYVECMVFQTSGGALNVNAQGNYTPEFWMVRVA